MAAPVVRAAAAAQLEIILEIDRRLIEEVRTRFPGDQGRVERVSLVEEGERKIRMADLAIVGSHSTNGVAAIHSDLLRTVTVKDLAEMFPERFSNKTNGVTPRRWLLLANPALAGCITEAIGDGWITDLAELEKLSRSPRTELSRRHPQRQARGEVAVCGWLRSTSGVTVDPDSIFDSQVKRIHEYKRQLLNGLRVVVLYDRLRQTPISRWRRARSSSRARRRRLPPGQGHHQVPQQPGRHDRRRSGGARPPQGRVPARVLRVAGRAADPPAMSPTRSRPRATRRAARAT